MGADEIKNIHRVIGSNLSRGKETNQSAIREMIYCSGPITRTKIAKHLKLSVPTITTTVNSLLSTGILKEIDKLEDNSKALGRKAYLIDIEPNAKYFLGLEMRGSFRRLCIVNYRGHILCSKKDDTVLVDYDENIQLMCKLAIELLQESTISKDQIESIGVSIPGIVNTSTGILKIHPGYKWRSKNIRQDIATLLEYGGVVCVENNACARAFGSQLFQKDLLVGANSFAYLYVSTGIACPFILKDSNFFGSVAGLGEMGHMVMDVNGPMCSCGNHGCLESISSEKAIVANCAEEITKGNASILKEICEDPSSPTMIEILSAQKAGDVSVCNIIETAIFYLGIAIANVENFVWPDTILIDGILFCDNVNRTKLLKVIYNNLYGTTIEDVRFKFIDYDDFNGARGAAAVAIHNELETYIDIE